MRRSRLLALALIGFLGIWLLWRQITQRQRAAQPYGSAPNSSPPVWIPVPSADSTAKQLASTAEQAHDQSDALAQPVEPAPPPLPHASEDVSASAVASEPPEHPEAEISASAAVSEPPEDLETEPAEGHQAEDKTEAAAPDDLIRIEGIGPKISTIMVAAGIRSFADLAGTDAGRLQAILDEAGVHTANPSTWPQQAHLAAQAQWDQLKELQDRIKNGRLED